MIKKPLRGASATIYDLDTDGKAHVKTTWTIKSLLKQTKILTIKQEAVVTTKEISNPKGYDERDYHFEPELQVGPRMTIIRYSLTKTIDPGESYSFTIEYDFGGYVRKIGNKWVFEYFRALIGPFADLFEAVDYTIIM